MPQDGGGHQLEPHQDNNWHSTTTTFTATSGHQIHTPSSVSEVGSTSSVTSSMGGEDNRPSASSTSMGYGWFEDWCQDMGFNREMRTIFDDVNKDIESILKGSYESKMRKLNGRQQKRLLEALKELKVGAIGCVWVSEVGNQGGDMHLGECTDLTDLLQDFIIQHKSPESSFTDGTCIETLGGAEDLWKVLGVEAGQVAKCLMRDGIHQQWQILHNHNLFSEETVLLLKRSCITEVQRVKKAPSTTESNNTHYVHGIHTVHDTCIPIRLFGQPNLWNIKDSLSRATSVTEVRAILDDKSIIYDTAPVIPNEQSMRVWYEMRPVVEPVVQLEHTADLEELAKGFFRMEQTIRHIEEYSNSIFCKKRSNAAVIGEHFDKLKAARSQLIKKAAFLQNEIITTSPTEVQACLHILHETVERTLLAAMNAIEHVSPAQLTHFVCDTSNLKPLKPPRPQRAINVVFLGKTGAGKSETVNLVVGEPVCKTSSSMESETSTVTSKEVTVPTDIGRITLNIVDTPGMFDTRALDAKAIFELRDVIRQCPDGIDVIIHTVKCGRFTAEEEECLKAVTSVAGSDIFSHAIFVFTHAKDVLQDTSAPDYIKQAATISTLKKVLKKHAGNRAVFIENKYAGKLSRSFQRNAILQHIFEILNEKKCKPFDKGIVRKIQQEQEEEMRRVKEEEDKRKDIERKRMQKLEQDQEALKVLEAQHQSVQQEKQEIERKRQEEAEQFSLKQEEMKRKEKEAKEKMQKQKEKFEKQKKQAEEESRQREMENKRVREEEMKRHREEMERQRHEDERVMQNRLDDMERQRLANEERQRAEQQEQKRQYEELLQREKEQLVRQKQEDDRRRQREQEDYDRRRKEEDDRLQRKAEEMQRQIQEQQDRIAKERQEIENERRRNQQREQCKQDIKDKSNQVMEKIKNDGLGEEAAIKLIDAEEKTFISILEARYDLLTRSEITTMVQTRTADMRQSVKDEGCFPASAKVVTPDGNVDIGSLKHGDLVLGVGPGGDVEYSPVIMFSHACPDRTMCYIKLHTDNNKVLSVSPGHYLHVGEVGNLKAADEVQVGDTVFTMTGEVVVPSVIVSVTKGWERGVFCPQTSCGSIIVDGVVSSCYTTFMAPWVAHTLLLPARVLFRLLPLSTYNWLLPYDDTAGMPSILNWSAKYVRGLKVPVVGDL